MNVSWEIRYFEVAYYGQNLQQFTTTIDIFFEICCFN